MKTPLLSVAVALTVSTVAAQGLVVPSKALSVEPNSMWFDFGPQSTFRASTSSSSAGSRLQYIYDNTDISVAQTAITAVLVRGIHNGTNQAGSYNLDLVVSNGQTTSTTASRTYAQNHSATPTLAFSGVVNLPATTSVPWPDPWVVATPFSSPFAYDQSQGSSLCIEFTTSGAGGTTRSWTCEGYSLEGGRSFVEPGYSTSPSTGCVHSGGAGNNSWGWSSDGTTPGGQFRLSLGGYPTGVPSMGLSVLFLTLGGSGGMFGPLTTPFDLDTIVQAQPNCPLVVSDPFIGNGVPMEYVDRGTSASIQIPNVFPVILPANPSLAGANFYTQAVSVDVDAQGVPGPLYPSRPIRWLIGTGNELPACTVLDFFDPALGPDPSGSVQRSRAISLNFN